MHIRFSPDARADLNHIRNHIALQSERSAERVIHAILHAVSYLEKFPFLGRGGRVDGTRELSVQRYPYIIVYTLPDQYHVDIERVLHSRQQFPPE